MNSHNITHLTEFVKHINQLPNKQRKLSYIKSHHDETIKKLLFYTYSQNHSFIVSKSDCLTYSGSISDYNEYEDIFDMLRSIAECEVIDSNAICGLIMGVAENLSSEDKETLLNIIDRDLCIGLDNYELNLALGLGYWDDWFIEDYDDVLAKESKYSHINKYKQLVA